MRKTKVRVRVGFSLVRVRVGFSLISLGWFPVKVRLFFAHNLILSFLYFHKIFDSLRLPITTQRTRNIS